ncbi:MAG: anthranilate synthase component I family protein [Bdellovibrionales bacterium]|nr:anthranilate synthase component I family protein [Bdellovibrionales bacterium]
MNFIHLQSTVRKLLADTVTPVSIYLRMRDLFPDPVLLESADFLPNEKSLSFIGASPFASFTVQAGQICIELPGEGKTSHVITSREQVQDSFRTFVEAFRSSNIERDGRQIFNGLFGFTSYDAIEHFEELKLHQAESESFPSLCYRAYRYIIAIDHYRNELFVLENRVQGETQETLSLDELCYLLSRKDFVSYPFSSVGTRRSQLSDSDYIERVKKCKEHIQRGDVFQIVPSRRFEQDFVGDEFNVYRALRSINPSPYLFYFDYGSFRLFGSSPEAQLVVQKRRASLYPIAGTYRRSGDETLDQEAIAKLREDPKENSEHVMLVDLARNDLSRHCTSVEVEEFKGIKLFSHVIHLTSKVSGTLLPESSSLQIFFDTFPMGTLTGAPKVRAMQILDELEPVRRGFYGGAVGAIGFDGSLNHAIVIRSFVSSSQTLSYQAGAGIVSGSNPERECQEVLDKLEALEKAICMASGVA